MSREQCQRCGEIDFDRRTLFMSCLYAMEELGLPFQKIECAVGTGLQTRSRLFYTLRVCKRCRGEWMGAIQAWFLAAPVLRESCGSGIFVRRNGANVEISREEWDRLNPGRDPVIFQGTEE